MNEFERAQRCVHCIDLALEALDLGGEDAERAGAAPVLFRGAQIGAEVEQIVLDPPEHRVGLGIGPGVHPSVHMEAGEADRGVGFVDRAVGGDPQRVLRHARTVAERGLALVAATGVDPGQPNHRRSLSI